MVSNFFQLNIRLWVQIQSKICSNVKSHEEEFYYPLGCYLTRRISVCRCTQIISNSSNKKDLVHQKKLYKNMFKMGITVVML